MRKSLSTLDVSVLFRDFLRVLVASLACLSLILIFFPRVVFSQTFDSSLVFCAYKRKNFGGASFCANENQSTLDATYWDNKVRSIKVRSGYQVSLFENANFSGDQEIVGGEVPLLELRRKVSSIQIEEVSIVLRTTSVSTDVCFFKQQRYQGPALCRNNSWNRLGPFWNDQVNSVKVPRGYQVTLYTNGFYRGPKQVITGDAQALLLHNRVSSIKIEAVSQPPDLDAVCFYQSRNYTGLSFCVRNSRKGMQPYWNNKVSALRVPHGYQVTLYEDRHYSGEAEVIRADTPILALDNKVSSFKITRLDQLDSDEDGVDDFKDVFPFDASETSDLDRDGIGDNQDADRDGDGLANDQDPFPDEAYETYITKAQSWLLGQQNENGSWGESRAEQFILTPLVVDALDASGRKDSAYFQGITWLENHSIANTDYQARRAFSLYRHGNDVSAVVSALVSAQDTSAAGRDAWGLSAEYLQSPIDTAIVLKSLVPFRSAANRQAALDYLKSVQLETENNQGWSLALDDQTDSFTTAIVVKVLASFQALDPTVGVSMDNAIATLSQLVDTASPIFLQAHVAHAAYVSGDTAFSNALFTYLTDSQDSAGSWDDSVYATATVLRALAAAEGLDTLERQVNVFIPDINLRAAINDALGRNRMDTLTRAELLRLTQLDAAGYGITDLTGLEWALNLKVLDVSGSPIISLNPIGNLPLHSLVTTQVQLAPAIWDDLSATLDNSQWQ